MRVTSSKTVIVLSANVVQVFLVIQLLAHAHLHQHHNLNLLNLLNLNLQHHRRQILHRVVAATNLPRNVSH
jgi:hypothetical protein